MAIVEAIINKHTDSWTWLEQALDAAQFSFFEDLPDSCTSALGCYNHRTGEAWLSLDALRIEHESYNRYDGPSSSDIVLHELAHAHARSTSQGTELLGQFVTHYAGCRSDRDGLSTDQLAEELLADTMAIAAMRATEDPSQPRIFDTRSFVESDYGYFRTGGFDGCLANSDGPDPVLVDAVYAATFDCSSEHAFDVFKANQDPYVLTRPSHNEQSILKVCDGDDTAVGTNQASPEDSGSSEGTGSVSAAAATSEPPPECNDINPVDYDVDPSLAGVHALGFVTLEEQPATFAGYAGCPLIVNFFASWCVPCVTEMPDFERFWNAHGAQVAVLGLAANDRLEDAIAMVADRGVTYRAGLDEGELFIDFGGLGMPTTVFVSPEGQILETHSGLLTLDDITARAEEHFGL